MVSQWQIVKVLELKGRAFDNLLHFDLKNPSTLEIRLFWGNIHSVFTVYRLVNFGLASFGGK